MVTKIKYSDCLNCDHYINSFSVRYCRTGRSVKVNHNKKVCNKFKKLKIVNTKDFIYKGRGV